jgi:hypothetical protein
MLFIPWNEYNEVEIQAIVSRLFTLRGYTVRNQHLADRSREKGADLIASKKGEVEKLAIQVKKKPTSVDVAQLHQLAKRLEETKKLIYVEEPSTDFLNEATAYLRKIDFWDREKLTKEILCDDAYLALLLSISGTQSARYLLEIQSLLLACYKETKGKSLSKIELPKPTYELYQLLWQAKDRACTLGKGLLLVGLMFDQTDRESSALVTQDLDYTARSFTHMIDELYIEEINPLYQFFIEMNKRYKEYIEYCSIERRAGTEWIYLMNFWFLLPGTIRSTFLLWKKEEDELKGSFRKLPIGTLEREYSIFDAIHILSKEIAKLGMGIEGIIDDIWRYAFGKNCIE